MFKQSRFSAFMALACVSAPLAAAQPQPAGAVEAILAPLVEKGGPGCAVALSKDGKTLIDRAFGLADLEHQVSNRPATVFEAGSASKQVAAAAVLILAEEGKVSLTDDIRKYLPEVPSYGQTITIDHLLNHTSGMRDWRFVLGIAGWPLGKAVHSNQDALRVAERQRELNHAPGAEYSYTNTGYSLAAIIVERVTGKSLAEFSRERLFGPLEMTSTQWRDDFRRIVKDRAVGYSRGKNGWVQDMPFENAYGAGGLLTTTKDLLIWNEALRKGRLGAGISSRLEQQARLNSGEQVEYARGLFVDRHRGFAELGHGGVTAGYRAWTGRYPEHGIAVAVLCNGPVNPAQLARSLADLHLPAASAGRPNESAPPIASRPVSSTNANQSRERWRPGPDDLKPFVGRYRSDEADATYVATVENGLLTFRLADREEEPWVLGATYRDTFVFPYGKIRFVRDKTGAPREFLLTAERVRELSFHRE